MTSIPIRSNRRDLHADAVRWALERAGHQVFFWPSGDFPARQGWSAEVTGDGRIRHSLTIDDQHQSLPHVRTVWNRRGGPPTISKHLDASELAFAEGEARLHARALMRTVAPNALWVNPPHIAEADAYKPLQLQAAVRAGFPIPETLFSNDPRDIEDFYHRLDGDVVFKCYRGNFWTVYGQSDRICAVNRTVPVLPEDLENTASLAMAPGIFQRAIRKDYEVRVTAMGRELVAVRINSQKHGSTQLDWRSGYHELEIEPFGLTEDVAAACQRYMRITGLRFGSFDFIVTPEGVYYFLEVNQMGQFLWKEIYLPGLPLLQMFCDFLLSADAEFVWKEKEPHVSFAAYRESGAGRTFGACTNTETPAARAKTTV